MAKTITRKSPEEKAAEVQALREWFDEWEGEQDPETLAMYIALHDGYSEGNALLIASQLPDATDVRGYRTWLAAGRQVRKGETGARIWQPKGASDEEKNESGEVTKPGRKFFTLVSVFDVTQTDPKEDA
jgi:antirestriction protein ArdC